jgi:hypothetical protein
LRKLVWLVVVAGLCSLGSSPSRTRGAAGPPAATPRPVGPTGIALPAADPMTTELQRELERGQRDYAALFQRLALSHDEAEAFEIQDDMRQQRVGLQIALLRIHAAYARRAGRHAFADQLEQAIRALIGAEPAPPAGPEGRRGL